MVITDGDDVTLKFLEENVKINNKKENIQIEKLFWGNELDIFMEKFPIGYKKLSFSNDSLFLIKFIGFDVIIGADIIYEYDQVSPLLDTVKEIINKRFNKIIKFKIC